MDMDLWSLGLCVHADATYPVLETYANISMNNICSSVLQVYVILGRLMMYLMYFV